MTTKCIHISANQYPKLPASHHSKVIWKELAKGCDEYHVVARSTDMTFSYSKEGNVHLHLLPSFGKRQFVFFLLSFLLPFYFIKIKPTHVIAQCPVLGGFIAAVLKSVFNFRLLVELHGEHYFKSLSSNILGKVRYDFFKCLTRFSFGRASSIRCLSESMFDNVLTVYGERVKDKLVVVPNRVDLTKFKIVKSNYDTLSKLSIITVGRFSELKNHINLIHDLFSYNLDFRLIIVGSGDLKSEYYKLFEDYKRSDDLIVYENITHEELASLLPSCDIYIHYSLSEGVPRAILEAMSCGLPVIATNVGYIKGVVNHGENGFLIEKPYREGLHTALNNLISSVSLRQIIGTNARQFVESNNEWNYVFSLYRNFVFGCRQ